MKKKLSRMDMFVLGSFFSISVQQLYFDILGQADTIRFYEVEWVSWKITVPLEIVFILIGMFAMLVVWASDSHTRDD